MLRSPTIPPHIWKFIFAAGAGLLMGVVGPTIAASIRGFIRQKDREVKETPTKDDDRKWEVVRPGVQKIADLLSKGDHEGARKAADEMLDDGV